MNVLVIAPEGMMLPELPGGARLRRFSSVAQAVAALRSPSDAVVLCTDGFQAEDAESVAAAIRAAAGVVVEVRAEPWDGSARSAISGACRGVISGFGTAGVLAAANLLRST